MSTNYYLINKKDQKLKQELDKLIKTELNILKLKLYGFNCKYDLDIEEEIEDKIKTVKLDMDYGIIEVKEVHICKTNRDTLTWQINEYWENEKGFIDFIEFCNKVGNKDKYEIQDDCSEVYSLNELLDKLHCDGQEVKYLSCDFC